MSTLPPGWPTSHPPALQHATTVVVGVSGGPDSLALLHWLHHTAPHLSLHVAHLDHQLRPGSADDAAHIAALASNWGLPATIEAQPIAQLAAPHRLSLEEAGRQQRYCFLARIAQQIGATHIAVAHHADDQAETILMHLLRGSGLAGLRGMMPVTPLHTLHLPCQPSADLLLVRPLLNVTRATIEAYCQQHRLPVRHDPTNADTTYFRNRLRHEILPVLAEVNPQIRDVLRRMGDVIAADYDVLEAITDQHWDELATVQPGSIALSRPGWIALPLGLRRGLLRRAITTLRGDLRNIDYTPLAEAADFIPGASPGQQVSLPGGILLTVDRNELHLVAEGEPLPPPHDWPWLPDDSPPLSINAPGETRLPGCGWTLQITLLDDVPHKAIFGNTDMWTVWVDAGTISGPLVLRTPQPGDRLQPLGLGGHSQAVGDLFTNRKLPLAARARLPLLVTGEQVVWVCGVQLDHRARITDKTAQYWQVKLIREV